MLEKILNFFSKFTLKQNLIFFGILFLVIGIACYFLYNNVYLKNINNDYYKYKLKENFNNGFSFAKKENLVNSDGVAFKFLSTAATTVGGVSLTEDESSISQERKLLKDVKEKYSSYITDEYFINNRLDKIKKINYEKNKTFTFIETGKKAFDVIFEKLFNKNSFFVKDGCLVLLEGECDGKRSSSPTGVEDIFYCDILLDYKKYAVGIIFLPFHKIFYPNNYYKSEEEFIYFKSQFNEIVTRSQNQNVYIIQIPEKIYNLEFNGENWEYVKNFTEEEEKEILKDEYKYINFLSKYFEKAIEQNSFKSFLSNLKEGNRAKIFF